MRNFNNITILVVGDVSLDIALSGVVERISPEAPVPVVLESSQAFALGCAGNVAASVAALGAQVTLLGVVGDDDRGKQILRLCEENRITGRFVLDESRPTICKTRIFAKHHQLLRIDNENKHSIAGSIEEKLIAEISKIKQPDFVIISDYHKGLLTARVVDALRRFGDKKIIADIKPGNINLVNNIFAITPNLKEAYDLTGIMGSEDSIAAQLARDLAERHSASVIFKRSEHGMTVFDKASGTVRHIPAAALQVFDVTGAGDTVIAALACMLAAGADLFEAAIFANRAAGIVVGKPGVATATLEEING